MISNNWKNYKFSEIAELRKEQIAPNGKEQPYIGLEHIEQQTLRLNGIGNSTGLASNKFKFYKGDILYGKLRPYFRKVYYADFDGVCSTDIFVIKNKSRIDKHFLYYLIATEEFTRIANSGSTGTHMPRADWNQLVETEWILPEDEQIQNRIGNILFSLDTKIDLNRKINQTLEQIVSALFQEMCVSKSVELEKGWQLLKLSEFIDLKNGYAFKGMDFIEEGVPVIKIKNVKTGKVILNQLSYVSREIADKAQRFRIKQNDLLVTMSGNRIDGTPETWVGKVGIFHRDGEYLLNQRVSILNIIDESKMSKYFLSQLLSSEEYQYYFISNATSSGGQANISPDLIYNTEIVVPPIEQLQQFNKLAKDIYNKIFANELEVETLTNLRDNLLPKLMKGEIKV